MDFLEYNLLDPQTIKFILCKTGLVFRRELLLGQVSSKNVELKPTRAGLEFGLFYLSGNPKWILFSEEFGSLE